MNRAQRIILVIYCLLLAYCCIWIPWRITNVVETQSSVGDETTSPYQGEKVILSRSAYSFVWDAPSDSGYLRWIPVPAVDLIFLRIVAVTAVAGAAFIVAGFFKPTKN